MTAFGASQVAIGLAADPTPENKKLASELPQSITDIGGIVADKALGNQNGEIRSAVQISSTILSAGAGFTIKTNNTIFWGSLGTSIGQIATWGTDNLQTTISDKSELPIQLNKKTNIDHQFEENK